MSIRDTRQAPWCWQEKNALRAIRKAFEEDTGNTLAFALAIYTTITELASNQQSNTLTFSQLDISRLTGLSRKTVGRVLERLEALGLIAKEIRRDDRGFLMPCEYQLLSVKEPEKLSTSYGNGGYIDAYSRISPQKSQLLEESYKESSLKKPFKKAKNDEFKQLPGGEVPTSGTTSPNCDNDTAQEEKDPIKAAAEQGSLFAKELLNDDNHQEELFKEEEEFVTQFPNLQLDREQLAKAKAFISGRAAPSPCGCASPATKPEGVEQ